MTHQESNVEIRGMITAMENNNDRICSMIMAMAQQIAGFGTLLPIDGEIDQQQTAGYSGIFIIVCRRTGVAA